MPHERRAGFHVSLDLEPDADPIAGTFTRGDGTIERFWGWLELMSTLERMTAGPKPGSTSPTSGPHRDADDHAR